MGQAFRSHTCGELRASHVGERVTLSGWVHRRRDHGHLTFLDLRDRYGITQVVTNADEAADAHAAAEPARNEWVVQASGVVRRRPEGTTNAELATGEVEVAVDAFTVLNPSKVPPFYINEEQPGLDESLRFKHRYLDLRRPSLQGRILLRARLASAVRRALEAADFVEIETPTLIRSHAGGGARLRRPEPPPAGHLLRPAAVPADPQAAAHGRRLRPLLPAGARLPRRGLPRRSGPRAHADRRRDELRVERGRDGHHGDDGHRGQPRGGPGATDHGQPIPQDHLRPGDRPIRIGQA